MSFKNKEQLVEGVIDAIFGSIARGFESRALKMLAKKDPEIAKAIKQAEASRKILQKRIDRMSKADQKAIKKGTYFD